MQVVQSHPRCPTRVWRSLRKPVLQYLRHPRCRTGGHEAEAGGVEGREVVAELAVRVAEVAVEALRRRWQRLLTMGRARTGRRVKPSTLMKRGNCSRLALRATHPQKSIVSSLPPRDTQLQLQAARSICPQTRTASSPSPRDTQPPLRATRSIRQRLQQLLVLTLQSRCRRVSREVAKLRAATSLMQRALGRLPLKWNSWTYRPLRMMNSGRQQRRTLTRTSTCLLPRS
mmetsp:Transcript_63516/g.164864  ORF Transcript_63516/g.164864 Transcript_63516/m.164864 type:complete len:229 (+) Transcript_63516:303-989(+)